MTTPASEKPSREGLEALGAPRVLLALVLVGVLLRTLLVVLAEHRLDADESTVGLMALDILEGKALPLFFYGTAYNGGGAWEAYLGAAGFALFGPSPLVLKLVLLGLWALAALIFADLCRRTLPGSGAFLALLFFCIPAPFFLEWSVKARGGFAETVLFSALLLWLAEPTRTLRGERELSARWFGVAAGLGLWASEMLLVMVVCAGAWLLAGSRAGTRLRVAANLLGGAALGLIPLLLINLGYRWVHLRESVLLAWLQGRGGQPLTAGQLGDALRFVLGAAWPLLGLGCAIAALRIASSGRRWGVGHVALAHLALYLFGFWAAGLRYMEIAPSRVLYALYPSLSLLLGIAFGGLRGTGRWLPVGLAAAWLACVSVPIGQWMASGAPREAGSWRSRWSLVDGPALRGELVGRGVDVAYVSLWTASTLLYATRVAAREASGSPDLEVRYELPAAPPAPGRRAAIVLPEGSPLLADVERALHERGNVYRRDAWGTYVILDGLDAARVHQGIGLPATFVVGVWPPPPSRFEGFN